MINAKMIGTKIAEARKKMNVSQAGLAERLYISAQAVGKWERGESMPDIITLNRLTEVLGVDLNYFSDSVQAETRNETSEGSKAPDAQKQKEGTNPDPLEERQMLTTFSGSNLPGTDFAGVTARNVKFEGSALRGSDFSGADLSGSSFKASDVREAKFEGTNLSDCRFYASNLSGARFGRAILAGTHFTASALEGARFTDVKMSGVKISTTDLRKAVFDNCSFDGVVFDKCDLRGLCLDGQTFTGVSFDNADLRDASFKGATLKNVAFRATHAITNKFYRNLKTIHFEGASMDKLTYAVLKGMGVDLSGVSLLAV